MMTIPTLYIDKYRKVETQIYNDGEYLHLDINGIIFKSKNFDDFTIINKDSVDISFTLNHFNELTDCRLYCKLPLILIHKQQDIQTTLNFNLRLDNPDDKRYRTCATFKIEIQK